MKTDCTNCFFTPKTAIDQFEDIVFLKDQINEFIEEKYNSNHLLIEKQNN